MRSPHGAIGRMLVALATLVAVGVSPAEGALHKSFIPLPEILTDPNEGNTFGLLGVVLFLDDQKIIKYILAPDVRYNKTTGVFPTFRLFGYPSLGKKWNVELGKSQHIDEKYELNYEDAAFWQDRLRLETNFEFERDSTERFYGIGNDTPEDAESNYTAQETTAFLGLSYRLQPTLELVYGARVRVFRVRGGGVDSVPDIRQVHPDAPGLGGATVVGQEFGILYDSRDDTSIPREGGYGLVSAEIIPRVLGSSFFAVKYALEVRKFVPFRDRFVLALHARLDYLQGDNDLPFYEQNDVGGRRTLRGFGGGRFVDKNRFFASAEFRSRVWSHEIFGVNAELEVAPFLDVGQVFPSSRDLPFDDLHPVGGLGFRGVVRPQVVGFVDVGVGSQGPTVFTGLEYPF